MTFRNLIMGCMAVCMTSLAQAQVVASFTVSHAGLMPSDVAAVAPGDTIQFIYGSGGVHPMTSGHGTAVDSPVFFPTVTVTPSIPEAFFTLEEEGTYYFHCGTNPANSNNWGTIHVGEAAGLGQTVDPGWKPLWNPAVGHVILEGSRLPDSWTLWSATGQQLRTWTALDAGNVLDLNELPPGQYILRGSDGVGAVLVK